MQRARFYCRRKASFDWLSPGRLTRLPGCLLAGVPVCRCVRFSRLSRFGSVSSSANADWPRQLAGASNDMQRRRAVPPSPRPLAGLYPTPWHRIPPATLGSPVSPAPMRYAGSSRPSDPNRTAHVSRRPVLRPPVPSPPLAAKPAPLSSVSLPATFGSIFLFSLSIHLSS